MVAPRRNALSRPVWTDEGLYDTAGNPLWQPQGQYEGPDMASWIGGQVNQFATKTAPEAIRRFNWLRMGYDPQGYLADSAAAGRAGLQIGGELASSLVQPLADLYDSAANSSRYGTPMEPGKTGLNALLNAANFGVGGGALSHAAGDVGDLGMAAGRNPQAVADSAMARAAEQGFGEDVWYRAGSRTHEEGLRPSSNGALGPGVYLAGREDFAKRYGPVVETLRTRARLMPWLEFQDAAKRLQSESGMSFDEASAIIRKSAQENGFGGVRLDLTHDGPVAAVWDPTHIRYPSADFDAGKMGSTNLLAANPTSPSLAAVLATSDKRRRPRE